MSTRRGSLSSFVPLISCSSAVSEWEFERRKRCEWVRGRRALQYRAGMCRGPVRCSELCSVVSGARVWLVAEAPLLGVLGLVLLGGGDSLVAAPVVLAPLGSLVLVLNLAGLVASVKPSLWPLLVPNVALKSLLFALLAVRLVWRLFAEERKTVGAFSSW